MPSAWASSGVVPRALAVSFVLPKKRLETCVSWFGIGGMERGGKGNGDEPAVLELVTNVFEIRVAHVVDAENEAVLVLWHALADVLKEFLLLLAGLLRHLGKIVDAGAF